MLHVLCKKNVFLIELAFEINIFEPISKKYIEIKNLKGCLWKQIIHNRTKIGNSVLLRVLGSVRS